MAYENVNASSLITSLNSCKNNLKYTSSLSILTSSNTSWDTSARDKYIVGLDKLVNSKYKVLETTIEKYISIAYSIKEYQTYQTSKLGCESQIQSLNSQLYKTVETTTYKNSVKTVAREQRIDYDVANRINNLKNTVTNCQKKMNELSSKINSF